MIEFLHNAAVSATDFLLGWSLRLPTGFVLFLSALLTALILAISRIVASDQDLLRRCAADRKVLKKLTREAKRQGDTEAAARHRSISASVGLKAFRQELKPLLVVVIPLAMLGLWCAARLDYLPPKAGDTVVVQAIFSASATTADAPAHIVPVEGVEAEDGWVKSVRTDDAAGRAGATASWALRAAPREEPYVLTLRFAGQTVQKELLVGSRRYAPPLEIYPGTRVQEVRLLMQPYKPFGIVPGLGNVLAPWLVGYLLLTFPLFYLTKRALRIR